MKRSSVQEERLRGKRTTKLHVRMIHILLLLVQVRVLCSDTMSNHEKLRTTQKRANIFPEAVYINKMIIDAETCLY